MYTEKNLGLTGGWGLNDVWNCVVGVDEERVRFMKIVVVVVVKKNNEC